MPEGSEPGVVIQGAGRASAGDDKRSYGALELVSNEFVLPKASSSRTMPCFSRGAELADESIDWGDIGFDVHEHRL